MLNLLREEDEQERKIPTSPVLLCRAEKVHRCWESLHPTAPSGDDKKKKSVHVISYKYLYKKKKVALCNFNKHG